MVQKVSMCHHAKALEEHGTASMIVGKTVAEIW